jgi:hypothetical protein
MKPPDGTIGLTVPVSNFYNESRPGPKQPLQLTVSMLAQAFCIKSRQNSQGLADQRDLLVTSELLIVAIPEPLRMPLARTQSSGLQCDKLEVWPFSSPERMLNEAYVSLYRVMKKAKTPFTFEYSLLLPKACKVGTLQ